MGIILSFRPLDHSRVLVSIFQPQHTLSFFSLWLQICQIFFLFILGLLFGINFKELLTKKKYNLIFLVNIFPDFDFDFPFVYGFSVCVYGKPFVSLLF